MPDSGLAALGRVFLCALQNDARRRLRQAAVRRIGLFGRYNLAGPHCDLRITESCMSLPAFLSSLLDDGRPPVPPLGEISPADRCQAEQVLADFELCWRLDLPGVAPPFHAASATWAAAQLFRACQYAVFRDAGPEFAFEPLADESELL